MCSHYKIFLCQELEIRTLTECRFELTHENLEIEPPQVFKIQRTQRNFRQNGADLLGVRFQESAQELGEVGTFRGRFTLRFTLKTAFSVQTSKKRETITETVSRFTFGSPEGIRTLDLMAENHASWTARRRGHNWTRA